MARMGRPPANIDKQQFEKLCGLQCTEKEICAWFNITDKTLNSWCKREYGTTFSDVFKIKREAGKISLRRTQFRLAEKSPAMAIFLGKQYLDQKEKPEKEMSDLESSLSVFFDALNEKISASPNGGDDNGT